MLSIYQNSNADNYESIKAGFIVRTAEYETIISTLEKRKSGDSVQHELILGRRGSGKSTLLKRIEVEIAEDEKLKAKYIPVNLAEEQAGIYRLMDLWEQVLKELYYWSEEKFEAKSFSEFADEQEYTQYLYGEIHRFCKAKKKKIVLLLDNFDRIVGNFSDDGNLLRETLINYHDLVLIAASSRMDEHFWSYDQPFYEFFRRHRLETLTSEEAFLLLNHWSDSLDFNDNEREKIKDFLQNNPGKVENIRLLTDGLPRTMLLFLKLVLQTERPIDADFLKKVMDEVTPLYQERLDKLTPPMRKIILEMAFMWRAVFTKEIAEQCRMESKRVAADLNTLTDKKIVEAITTDKRNNLYRIGERFFNMWLIVTQGNPDQKRKARWMSEFLESWYSEYEMQVIAQQHIEKLKTGEISAKEAMMLSKGLGQSSYISTRLRDEIIDLTKKLNGFFNDCIAQLPETTREITNRIVSLLEQKKYPQALTLIDSIENEKDKNTMAGLYYFKQEKYNLTITYILEIIRKGNKNKSAMFILGHLFHNQGVYNLAERYYLKAIEKGSPSAMFNLAFLYYEQNIQKEQVRQYIGKYDGVDMGEILIEIWVGVFNAVEERVIVACREEREGAFFIEHLLIHHQKSLVDKLFHHAEFGKRLQEQYTVLYYVSQILNGKEKENNLLLRIPPELQSTVDDVLQIIKSEQKRYSK